MFVSWSSYITPKSWWRIGKLRVNWEWTIVISTKWKDSQPNVKILFSNTSGKRLVTNYHIIVERMLQLEIYATKKNLHCQEWATSCWIIVQKGSIRLPEHYRQLPILLDTLQHSMVQCYWRKHHSPMSSNTLKLIWCPTRRFTFTKYSSGFCKGLCMLPE